MSSNTKVKITESSIYELSSNQKQQCKEELTAFIHLKRFKIRS